MNEPDPRSEYQDAVIEEYLACCVSNGVFQERRKRKLTQVEFGKLIGKSTSWVYRLEDPNSDPPTLNTLLNVAKKLGVCIDVRFKPIAKALPQMKWAANATVVRAGQRVGSRSHNSADVQVHQAHILSLPTDSKRLIPLSTKEKGMAY